MSLLQEIEGPSFLTAPAPYSTDLWTWAVALAGKAVVGVALGMGIASIYIDQTKREGCTDPCDSSTGEKFATYDVATDAALHLCGVEQMSALQDPDYTCNWGGHVALDALNEWADWFDDEEDHDSDYDRFDEMICLVEACRLRALRILSRPGHREAVEALARAVLTPAGIAAEEAEKLVREVIDQA